MFFTIMLKAKTTKEVTDKLLKYISNSNLRIKNPYFIEKDVKLEMEEKYNEYLLECQNNENIPEDHILPFLYYLKDNEGFNLIEKNEIFSKDNWRYVLFDGVTNEILKIVDYHNPNAIMEYYSFIPPWPGFYKKNKNEIFSLGLEFEDSMDYDDSERYGRFLDFTLNSTTIDFKSNEIYIYKRYKKIYEDLKILLSGKPYLSKKQIAMSLKLDNERDLSLEKKQTIEEIYNNQEYVILTRKYLIKNKDSNGIQDEEIYNNPYTLSLPEEKLLDYKYKKSFSTSGFMLNNGDLLISPEMSNECTIEDSIDWANKCFNFVKETKKEENIYLLKCYQ